MSDLKWFDGYGGQGTDELLALEGQYRIDSIVTAFEQAIQKKAESLGPKGLLAEEWTVLVVAALGREVNNGGFDQFFRNEVQYVPIIVEALRNINCPEVAAIAQEAIEALAVKGVVTVSAIEDVMREEDDERDAKLNGCDQRYYEQVGDLAAPLLVFIRRNRDKIELSAQDRG